MFSDTGLRLCSYQPQTSMQPHRHDEASLSLVVRGGFVERIGQQERDYSRGHIAYLPPGVVHSQSFGRAGARQVIIRPRPAWVEYLADCKVRLSDAPHGNSPMFRALGERLLREINNDDEFSEVASEGIILEIVAAFGRNRSTSAAAPKPPPWLCTVREYLHATAPAPPSMGQLAQVARRHEVHVAREFRRYFGSSVGAYGRRLRSEHAARLLLRRDLSLGDIALECGFSSHSHFCREFRAHFGSTPSQYRHDLD